MNKATSFIRFFILFVLLVAVLALVLPLVKNGGKDKPDSPVCAQYTVSFDVGEYGEELQPIKINYGEKPLSLPVPECKAVSVGTNWQTGEKISLADYEFCGWYYNGEKMSGENLFAFNQDVTLVAKWRSLWTENY